jgi:hypothetical protein
VSFHRLVLRPRWLRLAWVALGFLVLGGCGKKAPPLAPYSKAPGAPPEVVIRRKGDQIEIRFKVPGINSDGRGPAKIDRVQAFALTGPGKGVTAALFKKHATPVNDGVFVREPPPPPPDVKEGDPPPPPPPPRTDPGLDQSQPAIIIDQLTADSFTPIALPELEKQKKADAEAAKKNPPKPLVVTPPDLGPPLPVPTFRYYAVAGLNGKRKGNFSALVPVPLDNPPPAPAAPEVTVAEGRIDVKWEEPLGLRRPVIKGTLPSAGAPARPVAAPPTPDQEQRPPEEEDDTPTPEEQEQAAPPPTDATQSMVPEALTQPVAAIAPPPQPSAVAAQAPAGEGEPAPGQAQNQDAATANADQAPKTLPARTLSPYPTTVYSYAVYEMPPSGFTPPTLQPGALPPYPVQLTMPPVMTRAWSDSRFEVGVERCYAVRTVATTGTLIVESAPSPPACVKTQDVFAPAAPKNLAAVASEGAINLIWEANTETDLAGYLVLRGPAVDGGKLAPITPEPIKETTFRDTKVRTGVRYVYVVVAVDTAKPQNISAQSNRVEETAR